MFLIETGCKIGCGCGRKTIKSRTARRKAARQKLSKQKLMIKSKAKNKYVGSLQAQRLSMCNLCPYALQTEKEKKEGTRKCRKSKRFIHSLVVDMKFKCPIGRFRATS